MIPLAERVLGWLLPAILITFLALYVMAIRSGVEPETALLQSGAAGALLAVVGRAAVAVISVKPARSRPAVPARPEAVAEAGAPKSEQAHLPAEAGGGSADEQYEAVSG